MANTKFGIKQVSNETPSWVVKALVAITTICQTVPLAVTASPAVNQPTKDLIHLIFSIANVVLAAIAPMFGVSKEEN